MRKTILYVWIYYTVCNLENCWKSLSIKISIISFNTQYTWLAAHLKTTDLYVMWNADPEYVYLIKTKASTSDTCFLPFIYFPTISAIPLVCIMASIPWFLPYEAISIPYLPTFHVVASLAPWIGSILYHLFMNHEKGYSVYEAVLTIDLLGIWTTQTTGKRKKRNNIGFIYLLAEADYWTIKVHLMDGGKTSLLKSIHVNTTRKKSIYWGWGKEHFIL